MATPSLAFGLPPGVPLDNGKLQTAIPQDADLSVPGAAPTAKKQAPWWFPIYASILPFLGLLPQAVQRWLGLGDGSMMVMPGRLAILLIGGWLLWKHRKRLLR